MAILRRTKSVQALLEEFEQSKMALSTLELVARLRQQMNKSTVYRILDRLEDEGSLHSFMGKDGIKWYAKEAENPPCCSEVTHPHFQCTDCGKTECLSVTVAIPKLSKHQIESASLLLVGRCADCMG